MIKTLTLTPAILAALAAVREAEEFYIPGRDSSAVIEVPEIDLARAVLAAIEAQQEQTRQQRLQALPKAKPVPVVVEVALRRKWRRGDA